MSPGFHIGLRPHFTLGFAGVSPLQGSLSDWAFAVLCRGIVFVKCVWVCKWIVAFVFLYLIDCDVVLGGGLIWCGRAMSPVGGGTSAQVLGGCGGVVINKGAVS